MGKHTKWIGWAVSSSLVCNVPYPRVLHAKRMCSTRKFIDVFTDMCSVHVLLGWKFCFPEYLMSLLLSRHAVVILPLPPLSFTRDRQRGGSA